MKIVLESRGMSTVILGSAFRAATLAGGRLVADVDLPSLSMAFTRCRLRHNLESQFLNRRLLPVIGFVAGKDDSVAFHPLFELIGAGAHRVLPHIFAVFLDRSGDMGDRTKSARDGMTGRRDSSERFLACSHRPLSIP